MVQHISLKCSDISANKKVLLWTYKLWYLSIYVIDIKLELISMFVIWVTDTFKLL